MARVSRRPPRIHKEIHPNSGSRIDPRTLTIALHDEADQEVWRWLVERAFPVKWAGTDLDAGATQVDIVVELADEQLHSLPGRSMELDGVFRIGT